MGTPTTCLPKCQQRTRTASAEWDVVAKSVPFWGPKIGPQDGGRVIFSGASCMGGAVPLPPPGKEQGPRHWRHRQTSADRPENSPSDGASCQLWCTLHSLHAGLALGRLH